jgi:hypothetical protein
LGVALLLVFALALTLSIPTEWTCKQCKNSWRSRVSWSTLFAMFKTLEKS